MLKQKSLLIIGLLFLLIIGLRATENKRADWPNLYINTNLSEKEIHYPTAFFTLTLEGFGTTPITTEWSLRSDTWLELSEKKGEIGSLENREIECRILWKYLNPGAIKNGEIVLTYFQGSEIVERRIEIPVIYNYVPEEFTNIALYNDAYASSHYSQQFPASHVVDDDDTTIWGSRPDEEQSWLFIDLKTNQRVDVIDIEWYQHYYARRFFVATSYDGEKWSWVKAESNGKQENVRITRTLDCRYIGILCLEKNAAAYAISNFKVYKHDPPPTSTPINMHNLHVVDDDINRINAHRDVYVNGDYLYETVTYDGIKVYDIGNPAVPLLINHIKTEKKATVMCGDDNYLYVLTGDNEVVIMDIREQKDQIVNTVTLEETITNLNVHRGYLYLIDKAGRLTIVDVSDSTAPIVIKTLLFDRPIQIVFDNDYFYIASALSFSKYDITNIYNPVLVSTTDTDAYIGIMHLYNDHLYVILDSFSNPVLLIYEKDYPQTPLYEIARINAKFIHRFFVKDDYVYTLSQNDLSSYNYQFRTIKLHKSEGTYEVINEIELSNRGYSTRGRLAVYNNHVITAIGSAGTRFIDITDSENPKVTGELKTGLHYETLNFFPLDDYVYVNTTRPGGIQIFKRTAGEKTTLVKTIKDLEPIKAIHENYLITEKYRDGKPCIEIYDITDRQSPVFISSFENSYPNPRLIKTGFYKSYMILLMYHNTPKHNCSRIRVYDISDLNDVKFVIDQYFGGYVADMKITGDHIYALVKEEIAVFSLKDITSLPDLQNVYNIPAYCGKSLLINDNRLYAVSRDKEYFHVYDISDAGFPRIITERSNNFSDAIVMHGNFLMEYNDNRLKVYDTANPYELKYIKSLDFDGEIGKPIYYNNKLYLPGGEKGVIVLGD